MKRPNVTRRLQLALSAMSAILLILGILAVFNLRHFAAAERWHRHTYQMLIENNGMSQALDDMDINAHDFALTGDDIRLATLQHSQRAFANHFRNIVVLSTDDYRQQQRVIALGQAEAHWARAYILPIESLRTNASRNSDLLRLTELTELTTRAQVDQSKVRKLLTAIATEEQRLLRTRRREQQRLQGISTLTLAGGSILLAGLIAILSTALVGRVQLLAETNQLLQNEMLQRQLVQQEILESQVVFHSFLDNNPAIAFTQDAAGKVVYANKPFERIFDKSSEQLLGKATFHWLSDSVTGRLRHDDAAALLKNGPSEVTQTIPTPDGVQRSWLSLKFPFQNRTGELLLGTVAIDITARREAEEELKQSRSSLIALIENTADLIWSVDTRGFLLTFNSAFAGLIRRFTGTEPHPGDNHPDLLDPASRRRWVAWYQRSLRGERFSVEHSVEVEGQHYEMETALSPIINEGQVTGVSGFSRDITERKKIDRMKTEFISTVSHELRTPLTSIRGSMGLLAGGIAGELSEQARRLVDISVSNCDRLIRLINDILDVEKIEAHQFAPELEPLALLSLVEASVHANRGFAENLGVEIKLQNLLPSEVAHSLLVRAEPDRLAQVMANLLSNAAKFSPAGATVVATVELQQLPDSPASPGRVRVSVRDAGTGVPVEFHDRIFGKFAQADGSDSRQRGGTGLGLSISKAIIESFGGEIGFDPACENGAHFYFELPVWNGDAGVEPEYGHEIGAGSSLPILTGESQNRTLTQKARP